MRVKNDRTITVSEYDKICKDDEYSDVTITLEDIRELKSYIDDQNSSDESDSDESRNFLRSIRNGVQVKNFVGVLQTDSGLTIEILPKIYGKSKKSTDEEAVRKLFLQMLKTVRVINGKTFKLTNLNTNRNDILEVFISMFLEELSKVIKYGLKSNYVSVQSNERFLKGKLLMTQHIRKNSINKSHFYNEFDEYLIDVPENQLLKTTLEFLLKRSKDNNNLRLIREQLVYFDFVSTTKDIQQSISKIQLGRNYRYYEQSLNWCEIFLSGKSFTSFRGSNLAFAILFPMEKIFEAYIAHIVKKVLSDCDVSTQDTTCWLFDTTEEAKRSYQLRPDIVVKNSKWTTIADTKWKILDHKGPSQADLYQMYAYFTRYEHQGSNVKEVVIIYPYSDEYPEKKFQSTKVRNSEVSAEIIARIRIKYIDLLSNDIEEQIKETFKSSS
ncbi:McrC family protein [Enterococcus sp. 669A]|uniref:McrC family protein n=1 Tax=Candidatus Enterococcus moelleringii TaxID=2815325 RepID=A0ABS3LGI7_9ENTE|nr:McrC family protein [Enterococcus sp. 669A]MBO1307816.1 McrC family protein [Enterococcus sp. 669A]